ncbi:TolB family protein [Arcticibacter sp.]|jgi:Tol biopolymer transport system component|uniref:TolB family protein n=1 Tax=Arcticibacter sp. TaxID=1872630 RepID=UPI00388F3E19
MRLLKLSIPFLSLLIACNNNKTNENNSTDSLTTASLSSKEFALAYRDGDNIVVTSIDTMKQVSFGGATDPAISPDGKKLAYTISDSAGHRSIWVADLEHKTQAQLPVDNDNYYQAMWSPGGNKIAFSIFDKENRWKVGVMNTDHSGYQILDSKSPIDVYSPTWKNEQELVGHDLTNLYTLDLSGKVIDTQPLADLIGKELSLSSSNRFFYTKDGKKLIFNAGNPDVVKNGAGPNEAVYVLDLMSKETSRISPEGFNVPSLYVTADDQIFYSASKTSDSIFKIYTADLGGTIRLIVEKGMSPTGALK